MSHVAMFAGLVVDESGQVADVGWVGADACYVIDEDDFRRHIDAEYVDRQVLRFFKEQVEAHKDIAVRQMLQLLGKDDIFSKTALEYQIGKMDETVGQALPPQAIEMLQSFGFRIMIDFHGDVIDVHLPEAGIDEF